MPKALPLDPESLRKSDRLRSAEIPVHAYDRPFAEERAARGDPALQDILRRMMLIRAFETMLGDIKAHGEHQGVKLAYKGPAHLSVGQEGAAVGAALALGPEDLIFGSHRSHGEVIAKGLSAVAALETGALEAVMRGHDGGTLLAAVERHLPANDTRRLAEHFLLFGLLSEILMRETGFNGGMGGSMHAFFPGFGIYPNNAIVGASAGIAAGAALRLRAAGAPGIAVSMTGDGATGCGPVWEAMNFAAMRQFRTLWPGEQPGGLPALFLFTNNFYAMGGQTMGETMAWDRLARIGAGLNEEALHAETVDGTNPLAVAEAVARKRALLLEGRGPALLDVECYRASGHSSSDANAYRTRDEMRAWAGFDPIAGHAARLVEAAVTDETGVEAIRAEAEALIGRVLAAAADPDAAPAIDIAADPTRIGRLMFADTERPAPNTPVPMLAEPGRVARIRQNAKKARAGRGEDGAPLSSMRAITLRDGLFEAILHHMANDPELLAWGEECRDWGGAFGVYRGLSELFAHDRLFNAPISEAAIVATAVGHAMAGGRSLIELMYADFIGRAGDEILNQMAKWRAMSGGALAMPVVLRTSVGSKYGAQHSQDWSALIAHVQGLKVIYPATPHDAKGMMATALAGEDPVVVLESQRLYDTVELFEPGGVPEGYYRTPLGPPARRRAGGDATILAIGPALYTALEAAETLAADHGVDAEIWDARSLVPFEHAPILESVSRTGRLLVVTEACERGSVAQTLAATLARHGFADLVAPPRVLGSPNWIVPGAEMEATYFPQPADVVDAVLRDLLARPGAPRRGLRDLDGVDLARRGL